MTNDLLRILGTSLLALALCLAIAMCALPRHERVMYPICATTPQWAQDLKAICRGDPNPHVKAACVGLDDELERCNYETCDNLQRIAVRIGLRVPACSEQLDGPVRGAGVGEDQLQDKDDFGPLLGG